MSYAPDYQADVFISLGDAAQEDASWLVGFKSTLLAVLKAQLTDKDVDPVVYASGAPEPRSLTARDAAVLVAVISPESEFTADLKEFLSVADRRRGGAEAAGDRLFTVLRREVEDVPEPLRDAATFEYKPEDDGNPVKSGQATMEIGAAIAQRLESLRASATPDASPEPVVAERVEVTAWIELATADSAPRPERDPSTQPPTEAAKAAPGEVAGDKPYIFIMHSAEDAAAILPLREYLEREGRYQVGSSADFAGEALDTQAVQEAFDIFASECDACILFYGNAGAEWVTSSLKKFAQAQDRRAAGRDMLARTLLCIPPGAPEKYSQADPPRMGSVQFVRYATDKEVFEANDLDQFLKGLDGVRDASDA